MRGGYECRLMTFEGKDRAYICDARHESGNRANYPVSSDEGTQTECSLSNSSKTGILNDSV